MVYILQNAWALFLGMLLLMLGNGLQGSLLAVRGGLEGFDAQLMSLVMSGYFVGMLAGSRMAPRLIRRVGHVRVFAAMASLISAAFIIYAALPDPWVWMSLRILVGFAFACVYVVAESWLNDVSTNETRGQALSVYLIVQMAGIIAAQVLLSIGDPSGYALFVVISVLVSLSFLPILLSVSAAPIHATSKPMSIGALYKASPLGFVSALAVGAIFGAQFGMGAVYATAKGYSLTELATFVAAIYMGGLVMQYPLGFLSDRMDRRILLAIVTTVATLLVGAGAMMADSFQVAIAIAFIMGGFSNPLYSLIIAYVNDYLDHDDMPAAASGLVFLNGVGAFIGPLPVGWLIANVGPDSYFTYIAGLFAAVAAYALFRMTQRPAPVAEESGTHVVLAPQSMAVAADIAQEVAIDAAGGEESTDEVR